LKWGKPRLKKGEGFKKKGNSLDPKKTKPQLKGGPRMNKKRAIGGDKDRRGVKGKESWRIPKYQKSKTGTWEGCCPSKRFGKFKQPRSAKGWNGLSKNQDGGGKIGSRFGRDSFQGVKKMKRYLFFNLERKRGRFLENPILAAVKGNKPHKQKKG